MEVSFDKFTNKIEKTKPSPLETSYLLLYNSKSDFINIAKHFGIMDDPKCGVPRTAYKGVVRIESNFRVIYIAPAQKKSWSGYVCNW